MCVQHAMGLSWANHKTGGLGGGHAARQVAPTLDALPTACRLQFPAALLASLVPGRRSSCRSMANRLETLGLSGMTVFALIMPTDAADHFSHTYQ